MRVLTLGLTMLLAIAMVAIAADMAPPGQDSPLAMLPGVVTARVDVTAPAAAVETEVAEVARSGSGERLEPLAPFVSVARVNRPGGLSYKRWRAWSAG